MKILEDFKRYSEGSLQKGLIAIIFNQGFHAVVIYRLSYFFGCFPVLSIIGKILMNLNKILYGIEIDFRANFAGGLKIVHGTGIVVGGLVRSLGAVTLYQGVTLGNGGTYGSKKKCYENEILQQPLIYPNVVIFAHATVLGPVVLSKNVHVGAGTILMDDVEENMVVYNKKELVKTKRKDIV
ncbi:serine O-acetyltransferase [Exercitatus varius]|uniref:serine O-acetyltransferase n=1 Tax=Exercitatus varius TaxID=67857 RepID=UPI00294B95A7|nr:hypothetical protein [Exercitatus varius]MDG2943170.1 hypothetical protein [Exercitatus varius]